MGNPFSKPENNEYNLLQDNIVDGVELPAPSTDGFTFTSSLFDYELKGKWDSVCAKDFVAKRKRNINLNTCIGKFGISFIECCLPKDTLLKKVRKAFDFGIQEYNKDPINKDYIHKLNRGEVVHNTLTIQGSEYTQDNDFREIKIECYRKATLKDQILPVFVFCHGGGAIACSARVCESKLVRIALEQNIDVYSVEYRLAPETPAPGGIMDAYAVVKYIHANHKQLKVDNKHLAIWGESGGGYIAAGCCVQLAKRQEAQLVKLAIFEIAMSGDLYCTGSEQDMQNSNERYAQIGSRLIASYLTGNYYLAGYKASLGNVDIFPN